MDASPGWPETGPHRWKHLNLPKPYQSSSLAILNGTRAGSLAKSVPWPPRMSGPSGFGSNDEGDLAVFNTKVAQIYKKTGNRRAVQLLLGPTKMDSTVRYLGVNLDDALTLSEGTDP